MPGRILRALSGLGTDLWNFGRMIWDKFWNGMKSIVPNILGWIGHFVADIWDKVKKFFGLGSPSKLFYDAGKNLMIGLENGIKDHAHRAVNAITHALHLPAGIPVGPHSISGAVGLGRAMAAQRGWSGTQWDALFQLWQRESGWNRLARNPSSGAYGIPQALPASKMGPAANPPTSSAAAQIAWGLGYIASVYGNPVAAWAHETRFGWYDQGGWLPPGLSLALNTTGRPERVGGGNTYNITVNVPPTANKAEIGRATIECIVEAEKRSGSGWRR
jgi:hypothetical protein